MPDPELTPISLKKLVIDLQKELEQVKQDNGRINKAHDRLIGALRNYEAYEGVEIIPEE